MGQYEKENITKEGDKKKRLNINEYKKVYKRRFSTFKCLDNGEND